MDLKERTDQIGVGHYAGLGGREGSALGLGNVDGRLSRMASLHPLTGRRLLDVGCGNGTYTMRMASGFEHTVAVDIEPDRLGDFRRVCTDPSIEILQVSGAATSLPSGSFTVVTAIETFEHLGEHLGPTVAEIHRLLEPRGVLLVTTPNRWWPFEQHGWVWRGRRRPGWSFPFLTWVPAVHRHFSDAAVFTPAQLAALMRENGFEPTGLAYMMPPLDRKPRAARVVGPLLRRAEKGVGRVLGQTIIMSFRRR